MQYISAPVSTWCIGQASSMGSLLLCAGEKGMRTSLPNSRIMVHQPSIRSISVKFNLNIKIFNIKKYFLREQLQMFLFKLKKLSG